MASRGIGKATTCRSSTRRRKRASFKGTQAKWARCCAPLPKYRTYKPTIPREKAYDILLGMSGKLEKPLVHAFRDVALNR